MFSERDDILVRSRGSSAAFPNYEDNLLIPQNVVWPPAEIVKKLHKSDHLRDFDAHYHSVLTEKLGFYSDLQSVKSEDAITWSIFGYVSYLSQETQDVFLNSFLHLLGVPSHATHRKISLWSRLSHPDNFSVNGPEIDVLIHGSSIVLLCECKWTAPVGGKQGVTGDLDQMQIRSKWIETIGQKTYPGKAITSILIYHKKYPVDDFREVRKISWDELLAIPDLPNREELNKYYEWKCKFI